MPRIGEAGDPVDLEIERERRDLPDAGDPDKPLHVGVRNQLGLELLLEPADLRGEQGVLFSVQVALEANERREVRNDRHVVLREQPRHRVLAANPFRRQDEPMPQEIPRFAPFGTDHVRLGHQVTPEQLREGGGIDGVRLDLRVADGLDVFGVPERKRNPLGAQEVGEPVPSGRGFDHGALIGAERAEVSRDRSAARGDPGLLHHGTGRIDGGDPEVALVQIDAGVQHRGFRKRNRSTVRRYQLLGNIKTLLPPAWGREAADAAVACRHYYGTPPQLAAALG